MSNTATHTDSFKALAKRHNLTISALRTLADDLGLVAAYDPARRTWHLGENATTVRAFNEHLTELA
jgi:hypothetical protein